MSGALIAAGLWVLAATVTAFLPMRRQFPLGFALLLLALPILIWIGLSQGVLWALLGVAGFVSMFRKPLFYFGRKAPGRGAPRPDPASEREGAQ